MGIISAGIATAMTGSGVMVVPEIICQEPRPAAEKLLSERMPLPRLIIHVTMQPAVISMEMNDAIHSAILRSFEHQYHIWSPAMERERALEILRESALDRSETFYAVDTNLPLGVGLVIDGVEFPIFDPEADRFAVVKGLTYVLSHECDLDPANARVLNDMALICPVLAIEEFLVDCEKQGIADHEVGAILGNLAKRNVSRAVYFPPIEEKLPLGGLIYLNQMAPSPVARLQQGARVCTLTAIGVQTVDMALDNHFRRPKAQSLPLEDATIRNPSSRIGSLPEWQQKPTLGKR